MDLNESLALKLISEMKKPGRKCLYDLSNKHYKNNHIKQSVWSAIDAIGMGRIECQALWKSVDVIKQLKAKTSEGVEVSAWNLKAS